MVDVVFVGAGPVGLYAAIQVKLANPTANILMYEKYQEYQRKHVLIIEDSSYSGAYSDEDFQTLLKELVGKVPTSTIEEKLLAFAKQLKIEIQYKQVLSYNELVETHPEAKVIVGADGARSMVRKEVFGDKKEVENDLQYIAELKYQVNGTTRALKSLTEYPAVLSLASHLVSEFVGKQTEEGTSSVSIRFFISKEAFDAIKASGVDFKNPLHLSQLGDIQNQHLVALSADIRKWFEARKRLTKEMFVEGSDKITAINLPIYASKKFAKMIQGRYSFLVSDAAMGVPYFRALNAGLIGANYLYPIVSRCLNPDVEEEPVEKSSSFLSSYSKLSSLSKKRLTPEEEYNDKMSALASKEVFWAKVKSTSVDIGQSSAYSAQAVPISGMIKLRPSDRAAIKLEGGNNSNVKSQSSSSGCNVL